ncbi:MAG: hypothetical protein LBE38_08650 [Deltaproteobacteria bacterium]|jgi:hypothetical protein|nr:hypothetical protein [Deltaproteobacteria bacterium]
MASDFDYLRKRGQGLYSQGAQKTLGEMDKYFSLRPWGFYDVPRDVASLLGAFTEEAVSPEDFEDFDCVLEDLFGEESF